MKLQEKELQTIKQLHTDYTSKKLELGSLELQKMNIVKDIGMLQEVFATQEKKLVEKYGSNSVINIQTGEVTAKENG